MSFDARRKADIDRVGALVLPEFRKALELAWECGRQHGINEVRDLLQKNVDARNAAEGVTDSERVSHRE